MPNNPGRFEIMLGGSGGQGIIMGGRILAEAASIYDGMEAVMSQSYGPEARGGGCKAEVIISAERIDYPRVTRLDALLVMTQMALNEFGRFLPPKGLLIADETFIKMANHPSENTFMAPFSSMAKDMLETQLVANLIALGALTAITGVISRDALIRAVLDRVPDKVMALDRIAIDWGFKAVKDKKFQWKKTGR